MENNIEEAVVKEYDSHLMRRLLKFSKPYKFQLIFVIFLMIIATILNLLRPIIIKNAIDNNINGYKGDFSILSAPTDSSIKINDFYAAPNKIYGSAEASIVCYKENYYIVKGKADHNSSYKIEDGYFLQNNSKYKAVILNSEQLKVLRSKDINGIIKSTIYILLISTILFFLNYLQVYILSYTGQKIVLNIRMKLFKHVEGLSLSFYDKNPVGRLVTRLTNDIETLNEMYTSVLVNLFKDAFMLLGIIIAMLILNIKLSLISFLIIPIIIGITVIFRKYDRDAYREVRTRLSRINSSMSENITGMKTVQIHHKEEKKFKEFDSINNDYYKATLKQVKVYAVFRPAIDLVYSFALSLLIWVGGKNVIRGAIPFGVLFAFISYIEQFFQPINDFTEKYDILQSAMASAERIFMLMDNNEIIKEAESPVNLQDLYSGKLNGDIEFKNVWFAYKEDQWVLRDVSFKIKRGETVAFVGATGAGKTSIISLISRLYDIQKGEILIDGINIKDMKKDDLRRNIAVVLQDVFLFTGDIKSNVRLGNQEISDKDIIDSLKYVNADKFIEKLSDKYDSKVNERGTTFSQGERQLIAFARAIAFNPPILVLDEATSNIDTETEGLIQDALSRISKGRTTIAVAHRLSTIKSANKIIVLHKGKVRETGTHEELLEKKGLYYNLYQLQYKEI